MDLARRMLLLLAVAMLVAGTALAAPGNGKGVGQGVGGGDVAHVDNGNQKANGGGTSNNPTSSGCTFLCG